MYHPRLSGTYYKMGFKYGSILKRVGYKPPKFSEEKKKFAKECEKEVKRVFPEILEEFQGFAEGCGIPYDDLKTLILTIGAEKHASCSIFAASLPNPILGRNYNFYYEYKRHAETCLTMPTNAYWSIGNSTIFIGKEDGLNETGLAIAMSTVRIRTFNPGINWFIAVRAVLDKCSSVADAKKFLLNVKFSVGNNYLLIDKSGDMCVVEASPFKVKVRTRPKLRRGDKSFHTSRNGRR
jgi:predicted choloylglycine hydrolase